VPGIFISYRRGQTSAYAGRLYDMLAAAFGADRVFMDLNAIDPGADFVDRIEEAVGDADALLVVIGTDWADSTDAHGRSRLAQPDDFVRREILGARERDTLIIPVLVQGAAMPAEERLPEPLRFLGRRHAIELTDPGWSRDAGVLVDTLSTRLPPRTPRRRRLLRSRPAALAITLGTAAAVAGATLALNGESDRDGRQRGGGLRLSGQVEVGGYPLYASAARGKVWVAQEDEDRLKVFTASDQRVSDTGSLGTSLTGLAAAGGRLWVGAYGTDDTDGRGTVVEVDPSTGRRTGRPIRTTDPIEIAADDRSLWITDQDGVLQRADIRSRRVTKEIQIDGAALDVALLGGVAWAPNVESGQLLSFDAGTGRPHRRPIDVGARPISVAAARGVLWVATDQGQLVRVTPGGARQALPIGGEGNRVVEADGRRVWVIDAQRYVVVVDPSRMIVTARLRLPEGALQDIALDAGGAWVLRARSREPSTVARVVPAADA